MWTLHTKNDDHWIPIATLAGFKRMREYNTKYGIPWIAETLRNSEELLEVDEAGANVRRAIELKPPGMTQFDNSAYAVSRSCERFPRLTTTWNSSPFPRRPTERFPGRGSRSAAAHRKVLRGVRADRGREVQADR